MFREMTVEEQYEVEGGAFPPAAFFLKAGALFLGGVFLAGTVKGCTDEAAK